MNTLSKQVAPLGAGEVVDAVRAARQTSTPVFVTSSGEEHRHNYGGDSDGGISVDMRGMSGVIRVDRRNRAALVEPGVTFGTFTKELTRAGLRANMPLCPRPSKSVVASALEREPVTMPRYQWDLVDPLMSLEVVFGTGDLFRAGSGAGPGTLQEQWASGQAQKTPLGPSQFDPVRLVQGAQGSLGIVTWASIRLELKPSLDKYFFIAATELDDLVSLAYRLSHRKLGEHLFILNSEAFASLVLADRTKRAQLAGSMPAWVLVLSLAGFDWLPEERLGYQEADARGLARSLGLEVLRRLDGIEADSMRGLLAAPSAEPYWMDRATGRSSEVFFLATMDDAGRLLAEAAAAALETGYEPGRFGVYLQPLVGGRIVHVEIVLPHEPGTGIDKAFDRISRAVFEQGAYFSRPYGAWASMVWDRDPDMKGAVEKIKKIFDPDGIMNPGRMGLEVRR